MEDPWVYEVEMACNTSLSYTLKPKPLKATYYKEN